MSAPERLLLAGGGAIPNSPLPVLVLPAGTGHRNAGADPGLVVVGADPDGMAWDLRRGDPAEREEVLADIAAVPLPRTDPVHGGDGPLIAAWRS